MAKKPSYEESEHRATELEIEEKRGRDRHSYDTRSDSALPEDSKIRDPSAITVFSVALVILIVLSFFLIKNVKTYWVKPVPADFKNVVNSQSQQIKESPKKSVEPVSKNPRAPQFDQGASPANSLTIKAKLPKTTTDQELLEFVQREDHIRILHMPGCLLITDISPLSNLTHLEELHMGGCKNIQSIAPLSGLKNLRKLIMSDCISVTDISPLLDLGSLTEVYMPPMITNEQLALVIPKLPELTFLALHHCKLITDISPLSQLRNLYTLGIVKTEDLSDITPLAGVSELRHLSLTSTAVSDLSPLSELPYLTSLTLYGSRNLTDLSPLTRIKSLKSLGLNGSQGIRDLSPLSGLTYLTKLSLANIRELTDISPLYGLTYLKRLDLVNSKQVSTQQINELKRALPNCVIVDPYHYDSRRAS